MKNNSLLTIKVIPRAKSNRVEKRGEDYVVHVTAPAEDGRANKAVIKIFADYFDVSPSSISIVRGATSRRKIITIEN